MLTSDGDIIRGLGFVTLYSSYAEEEVDNLLERLAPVEIFNDKMKKWPISRKLDHAARIVRRLACAELQELEQTLQAVSALFARRNEIVHGRIYAGFEAGDTLRSGRPNTPDRPIEATELYDLANNFMNCKCALYRPTIFKLPRCLNAWRSRGA